MASASNQDIPIHSKTSTLPSDEMENKANNSSVRTKSSPSSPVESSVRPRNNPHPSSMNVTSEEKEHGNVPNDSALGHSVGGMFEVLDFLCGSG